MDRKCLLTGAYADEPMTLGGKPLYYSSIANEIIRELKCAGFCDDQPDQTHYQGMCEGIMVMFLLANGGKAEVMKLRKMSRAERHILVNDFILEHSDEIDDVMADALRRIEATLAASTEGDGPGKPELPQASTPS